MPAPIAIAPIAIKTAALVAGAALTYAAVRARGPRTVDAKREDMLDETPEGLLLDAGAEHDGARGDGDLRWKRAIRLGPTGPGVAVDLTLLVRLRVAPVRPGA